jgi:hypothetical protein
VFSPTFSQTWYLYLPPGNSVVSSFIIIEKSCLASKEVDSRVDLLYLLTIAGKIMQKIAGQNVGFKFALRTAMEGDFMMVM